ncbi:MAG: hypothetical protein GF418_13110 [Chitinivibrionales bacterium]|nr:hypothetical protein [Chitinivibrionales bacterium]MBD3396557.1 hypothetical protein [Chitinivibrionales bacterium]
MRVRHGKIAVVFTVASAAWAGTLTLPEAQELLFTNNPDVQIAEAKYLKSLVAVSEAKASYYPTAETHTYYNYQSKPNRIDVDTELDGIIPTFGQALGLTGLEDRPIELNLSEPVGDHDRFEWGVDISYPVFTGFSRKYSVAARQAGSTVYCLESITVKDRLSLRLGLLYFAWELSVKRLEVQKTYIDQVSEHVVQVRNLYEAGVEARSKVLEASARLESAKVDMLAAEGVVDSLRLELIDFLRIRDTLATPGEYEYELPQHVIDSRPRPYREEIVTIDSTLSQLELTKRALFGQRLPRLVAMAGYRVGNPGIVMGGDEFIDWGVAGLQLRWTIYEGQKNWAKREQLNHDMQILKRQREKQLAKWEKMAAQERLQIQKAHRMHSAAKLALDAAVAFAEDLENALTAGVVSSTEYLNALAAVSNARFRVARAETMRKMACLRLAYALGESMEF